MATQRYISTSFWDDEWVGSLTTEEKLCYLYLLTNPLTNIAGIYKITMRRIAYDMDMDRLSIGNILAKFEKDKKAYYLQEYIIIPSWPKHQRTSTHPKIKAGIFAILDSLSYEIILYLKEINYNFDLSRYDRLSKPTNYSDPDPDPDPDFKILSGKPDGVEISLPKLAENFWEPLDYLCKKSGRNYSRTGSNLARLKARYAEGCTVEQLKRVIDHKADEWAEKDDFEKYLRPETIFGTKLDTYIAQTAKPKEKSDDHHQEPLTEEQKEMRRLIAYQTEVRQAEIAEEHKRQIEKNGNRLGEKFAAMLDEIVIEEAGGPSERIG